jgi:hypothetical protein
VAVGAVVLTGRRRGEGDFLGAEDGDALAEARDALAGEVVEANLATDPMVRAAGAAADDPRSPAVPCASAPPTSAAVASTHGQRRFRRFSGTAESVDSGRNLGIVRDAVLFGGFGGGFLRKWPRETNPNDRRRNSAL